VAYIKAEGSDAHEGWLRYFYPAAILSTGAQNMQQLLSIKRKIRLLITTYPRNKHFYFKIG